MIHDEKAEKLEQAGFTAVRLSAGLQFWITAGTLFPGNGLPGAGCGVCSRLKPGAL